MLMRANIEELKNLSRRQKISLVQLLWDDIASEKDIYNIPATDRRTLERTLKNIAAGKTNFHDWKEVRRKYFSKA
jgi:putative addiction module component (TIGR02574 family)